MCNISNFGLNKWCYRALGFVWVLVFSLSYIASATAEVCFLPSGGCQSQIGLPTPTSVTREDCSRYASYTRRHLDYADECVTCGGYEYCKCGSDRKIVGNVCVCRDSDKIIQGGSCTACPTGKEPATAITCQCKSEYNYSPVANETCTEWCEEDAAATGQRGAADANIVQGAYAANSQSSAECREFNLFFDDEDEGTSYTAGNRLYKKSSCSCNRDYEYVGALCLPICDSSKGLTRSGTECVCSDSKKEWSNTENKCVCKTEYDPDGNGGCLTPGCQNPHQVRVNGTCQCDTNSGYYDSIDICQLYLPSTQAYNLNWWDLLQQKATNAVYEVAQCLMPVKAVYAVEHEGYSGWFPQIHGEFEEFDNDTGESSTQQKDNSTINSGFERNTNTPTGSATNTSTADGVGNGVHLDEGIEARCRKYCAGSTAYSSCMANCMGYELNDEDLQGTTVGIDGEYEGPVGGGSGSVPTVSYSCVADTLGTCWYVKKTCAAEYNHTKQDNETCTGTPCDGKYRASDCMVNNGCSRFTYFYVDNTKGEYTISVDGAKETFNCNSGSPEMPCYKVCENAAITLTASDSLCRLDVSNWYFSGYNSGNGEYGTGKSISFTVTNDFVQEYLNDVGWLTEDDEDMAGNQYIEPIIGYVGYSNETTCREATGKSCTRDSSTSCYIPNTQAIIYCSYDEILQTGNGCWGDSSWYDAVCEGDIYTPCEVDYNVVASKGSSGTTICGGAQGARNQIKYGLHTYGPTAINAGEYELGVGFVGKLGYGHSETNFTGWDNHNDLVYEYWVPDVMLIMDDMSMNSFKCYNIMQNAANRHVCSVGDTVNIGDELGLNGLRDWVDPSAYANAGSTSVSCPSDSIKKYNFEAGKTYYIYVGVSASHGSDSDCTQAHGCGYQVGQ